MPVSPIPDGYTAVTPYLFIDGCAEALDFYKRAFGAAEVMRLDMPGGKIMHAEMAIAGAKVMLTDANPDWGCRSPKDLGGHSGLTMLYVEDVDQVFAQALDAGATEVNPVMDQFWGDRMGTLSDPFGHVWSLATHIEDVPSDEMARRQEEMLKQMAEGAGGG